MERTKEQKKAIALHGSNVLVAAAAGSGKTSVLIERILTMVSDETHPIDIDRLLVVTFTNAAAAEMRERMERSLEEKFLAHPENKNLQKQMALLRRSHIMTIDSFCAEVLRNHFQLIDLDPSFRIADRAELKLLEEDVLSDVLEELYQNAEESDGFLQLADSYAAGKSDAALEEMVLALYRAASAYPYPKQWLLEQREEMEHFSDASPTDQKWMQKLLFYLRMELKSCLDEVERLIKICEAYAGMVPYLETLEKDRKMISDLLLCETYQEYADVFFSVSFAKLGRIKTKDKETLDASVIEEVKKGRDGIKKLIVGMKENYFPEYVGEENDGKSQENIMEELSYELLGVQKPMIAMIDTVLKFSEAYAAEKKERNILDFSDQEHLALQILSDEEGNPTKAALELREYFEEILIDEYQDSNRLQESILTSISKGRNTFLVGDVKQSIYKFRLARPELFMEKYRTYAAADIEDTFGKEKAESCRIDLSKNFRSRGGVLDTVNYLFSRIMGKQFGNIEYDNAAALYYGSGDSYCQGVPEESEILLITRDDENVQEETSKKEAERDRIELEAVHIAGKIKQLVAGGLEKSFPVREGDGTKAAEYGDIAVLLRTMSGWSEVFLKVFEEAGIPAVAATSSGYFEASEIKVLLNLLKIIDNEDQDIPLAAVMLSSIGNFSPEETAVIRTTAKEAFLRETQEDISKPSLRYACKKYLELSHEDVFLQKLHQKLKQFFSQLKYFRNLSTFLTVPELIEQILFTTGYDSYVRAMTDGEKRYGNVRVLIKKAEDFEKTSYHGLFQFNRYIERLKKYEIDFGEADSSSFTGNAVRIMSIHKSKGLEFPIVFVSGMGKQFNLMDTRKNLVIHPDLGLGPDYIDIENRTQVPTVLKRVLQKDMITETLAEEMRVLYVAMTRAGEKLIMTGFVDNVEESLKKWKTQGNCGRKLPFFVLSGAKTFLDMLMPVFLWGADREAVSADNFCHTGFDTCPVSIRILENRDLVSDAIIQEYTRQKKRQDLLYYKNTVPQTGEEAAFYEEFMHLSEERYPYEAAVRLKTKFTVSELKKASFSDEDEFEPSFDLEEINRLTDRECGEKTEKIPSWGRQGKTAQASLLVPDTDSLTDNIQNRKEEMEEKTVPSFVRSTQKEIQGVALGTIYHKVMQWLDFTRADTPQKISLQLGKLEKKGILSKEERRFVKASQICGFTSGSLGRRIATAQKEGKLFREQPFVMGEDAQIFAKGDKGKNESLDGDFVLVQGIIDLFFEEDGKLVLLDYKTDRVSTAEELKQRYYRQLDYYAEALMRARQLPVEEKYLYSFRLEELISL